MFKRFTLNRLLVLTATAGFAFLFADTILEHWNTFSQETMTFIPPLFSLTGLVLGLLTIYRWKSSLIRIMHLFLFLSFIVAAGGIYLHLEIGEDDENITVEEQIHEEKEKAKPLLAPLAFGGVAVIGLLGTSRKWESEVISK